MDSHYEAVRRRAVQRLRRNLIFWIHAAFYGLMLLALIVDMIRIFASQSETMRVIGITLGGLLRQFTYTVPMTGMTETLTRLSPTFDVSIAWAFLLVLHWMYVDGWERFRVWWQRIVDRMVQRELGKSGAAEIKRKNEQVMLGEDGELVPLVHVTDLEEGVLHQHKGQ